VLVLTRGDLAHPPARSILDAGLPLEGWADLKEAMIHRFVVLVKRDFNRAEALVDAVEQGQVTLFSSPAMSSRAVVVE